MVNVSEISMRGEQRGIGIYFITERSRIALTAGTIELKVSLSLFHDFRESNFYKSDLFAYLFSYYSFIIHALSISRIHAIYMRKVTRPYYIIV